MTKKQGIFLFWVILRRVEQNRKIAFEEQQ